MKTKTLARTVLCTLALLVTGCTSRPGNQVSKVYRIGIVTPLTGEVQDLGKEMLAAAQLAVGEANAANPGVHFELIPRDDQGSAASAALVARSIVQDPSAIALIAAGTSAVAKGLIEAVKGSGIAVLTSTATASDLTGSGAPLFRVIPPNSAQAASLAMYAHKLGVRTAAIIFEQDDYSVDLKEAFKRSFTQQGGAIIGEAPFEPDETAFRSQLNQLANVKPGVILAAAQHVPVARILIRAREMGISQPILAGETAFTDKLLAALGKADPGQFFLTGSGMDLEHPSARVSSFLQAFEAKSGKRPGMYGCYTYDAVSLVTHLAAKSVGIDRQHLITALQELKGYDGVTGLIAFEAGGNVAREYTIYAVRDGGFQPLSAGAQGKSDKQ
jgi:branched-chain amino acid transport system substrate-binding protein